MLEDLYREQWDNAFGFLASGSPPIYVRLMGLNALFLGLYAIRKAAGAGPMSAGMSLFVQLAVLGANLMVLYQPEVEAVLERIRSLF